MMPAQLTLTDDHRFKADLCATLATSPAGLTTRQLIARQPGINTNQIGRLLLQLIGDGRVTRAWTRG